MHAIIEMITEVISQLLNLAIVCLGMFSTMKAVDMCNAMSKNITFLEADKNAPRRIQICISSIKSKTIEKRTFSVACLCRYVIVNRFRHKSQALVKQLNHTGKTWATVQTNYTNSIKLSQYFRELSALWYAHSVILMDIYEQFQTHLDSSLNRKRYSSLQLLLSTFSEQEAQSETEIFRKPIWKSTASKTRFLESTPRFPWN
jgi:hypothetical protein